MNVPGRSPAVIIRFRAGTIELPGPPYAPKSYTVRYFDKKNEDKVVKEETHNVDWVGGGWHFQADEVARCIKEGKLESSLWGHDKTTLEMTIFDEVRETFYCQIYRRHSHSHRSDAKAVTSCPKVLNRSYDDDDRHSQTHIHQYVLIVLI